MFTDTEVTEYNLEYCQCCEICLVYAFAAFVSLVTGHCLTLCSEFVRSCVNKTCGTDYSVFVYRPTSLQACKGGVHDASVEQALHPSLPAEVTLNHNYPR
jgi:hypothetical protein